MGRLSQLTAAAMLGVAALGAAVPAAVHANGAFPDSQSILTPADRPGQIIMATNFGVILSPDAGATWLWSCETEGNAYGTLYQLAPLPRDRLFTVANLTLAYSDDGTCSWQTARGVLAELPVTDAYVDPSDANHVLAIGAPGSLYSLYESTDGGATFGPPLYTAPADAAIQGVEIAQSDPLTIYMSMTSPTAAPLLARSTDGGAHFTVSDLSADLGPGWLRIIAVDPEDPARVLLRFLGLERSVAGADHRRGHARDQTGHHRRQLHVVRPPAVGDDASGRHGAGGSRARVVSLARSWRELRDGGEPAVDPRPVSARRDRLRRRRQLPRRLRAGDVSGRRRNLAGAVQVQPGPGDPAVPQHPLPARLPVQGGHRPVAASRVRRRRRR